jgi:polygalacturonase
MSDARSVSAKTFGAKGDGESADGAAIQAAIDAAGAAGGGEVSLSPGAYVSGSLFLREGVLLRLERGAILLGSRDPRDYPLVETRWEGRTQLAHAPLVGATGVSRVGIAGGGAIDGRGEEWWRLFREGVIDHPRPRLVSFDRCEGVLLDGFEARNSPSWTIHPLRSRNVVIRGLSIVNPPNSPNTDGIDPESCSAVRIADCFVSVGDDCIAIKSGIQGEAQSLPCENVIVTGCVLERGHGGVVLGSEMSGGIRDVVIADCVFRGTDRGIRMKTRRGRGGSVERVRATSLVMDRTLCPFTINSHYGCGAWNDATIADRGYREVDEGTPSFADISFASISANGSLLAAAWLDGLAEMPIRGLSFEDVSIELCGDAERAPAEMSTGAPPLSRAGFHAYNVSGLRLHNLRIRGQRGPAYTLESCHGLRYAFCDPSPRRVLPRL